MRKSVPLRDMINSKAYYKLLQKPEPRSHRPIRMLELMGQSHGVNYNSQRKRKAKEENLYLNSTYYRLHPEKQAVSLLWEQRERKEGGNISHYASNFS